MHFLKDRLIFFKDVFNIAKHSIIIFQTERKLPLKAIWYRESIMNLQISFSSKPKLIPFLGENQAELKDHDILINLNCPKSMVTNTTSSSDWRLTTSEYGATIRQFLSYWIWKVEFPFNLQYSRLWYDHLMVYFQPAVWLHRSLSVLNTQIKGMVSYT